MTVFDAGNELLSRYAVEMSGIIRIFDTTWIG
jgi:hypothetical protein